MLKLKPIVRFLSAAGSALLLVAACGQDSAESQDVSDDSETHSPAHQRHAEITVHTSDDVKPRNDLENERVDPWTGHEIVDDSTIRIFFTGGDPKCFGAKPMIEESPSEIRIAIIIGSIPEASETCHALGVLNAMTVETAEKINGRNIVRWDNPGL